MIMKTHVFFYLEQETKRKRGLGGPRKAKDRNHHPHSRNKLLRAETEDIRRPPLTPCGMGCIKESKDVGVRHAQFIQLNPNIFSPLVLANSRAAGSHWPETLARICS